MKLVSLFSGIGGLDIGFNKAGYDIVWANEFNSIASHNYRLNHSQTPLIEGDITLIQSENIPNNDIDGVIGGPPCQSWSLAGNMKGGSDKRGSLIYEYVRVINHVRPKFFLFENVKGMLSKTHLNEFINLREELKKTGYEVYHELLNAIDYGVAQTRERVFIVGIRNDIDKMFFFPEKLSKKITQKMVIGDLEQTQKPFEKNSTNAINNQEYFVGSFSSIFMSRNRIRLADEPSFTIQASARQTPLHYNSAPMKKVEQDKFVFTDENNIRRLSVRECARIQGFDDSFKLEYKDINDAYKMIGNAVPIELAYNLAIHIKKIILT